MKAKQTTINQKSIKSRCKRKKGSIQKEPILNMDIKFNLQKRHHKEWIEKKRTATTKWTGSKIEGNCCAPRACSDNHIFMKWLLRIMRLRINPLNERKMHRTQSESAVHKQKGVNPTGIEIKQQSNITDLFLMLYSSSLLPLLFLLLRGTESNNTYSMWQSEIENKQRMSLHLIFCFPLLLLLLVLFLSSSSFLLWILFP